MDPHEQAMGALRDKLAKAKARYDQAITEANALRPGYVEAYSAWWESTRRGRSAGGRVPEHVMQLEDGLKAAAAVAMEHRQEMQVWRKRIIVLEWARIRGDLGACPVCKQETAVFTFEEYEDVSECCLCGHTQIRRIDELGRGPKIWDGKLEGDVTVKWRRGKRTPVYYI
jgi:Zn ribbon nucleic-acid-binding protein